MGIFKKVDLFVMGNIGDKEIETKSLFVQKTVDFLKVDGIFDVEEIS